MSASATLRARTSTAHDQVDAAFSDYRLDNEVSYLRFLQAHARAVPAAETLLLREGGIPAWRSRTSLLAEDLAILGSAMPAPLPFMVAVRPAVAWGVLYVLEGSRLGGRLLADRVPANLPSAYLCAIHDSGEWRETRSAIETQAAAGDAYWLDQAVAGAQACFDLYLRAAAASPP